MSFYLWYKCILSQIVEYCNTNSSQDSTCVDKFLQLLTFLPLPLKIKIAPVLVAPRQLYMKMISMPTYQVYYIIFRVQVSTKHLFFYFLGG